jgi:hypothetical protein
MRQVLSLRAHHWLILIGALVYGTIYAGLLDVRGIAVWFSNRPEVVQAFSDPNFGRADALILVFSTLFLGPLALLLGTVALIFVLAVFGGFLLPLVRWFRLPDWVATALVFASIIGMAWAHSEIWLPPSLKLVGLFARACRIVINA